MPNFATARTIALAIRDDPDAIALVRAERAALALKVAQGGGDVTITSSTVNQQTFSGMVAMTAAQRLRILAQVVRMIDAGFTVSDKAQGIFPVTRFEP
jgi:pyocin large subunit-like protein